MLVTLVALCLAAAAGAIVFGVRDARADVLCDGIDSINKGEQRVCRPPRTGDVRLSRAWPNLTAYRYAAAALPGTVPHTAHWARTTGLYPRECAALNFSLAAGGRANYTFRAEAGGAVRAYLMTAAQYRGFREKGAARSEWACERSAHGTTVYTAKQAGIYVAVVATRGSSVRVEQEVTVTTTQYRLSRATARETCAGPEQCAFWGVRSSEVVVLEYTGDRDSVHVDVLSGNGPRRRGDHFFLVVLALTAAVLGVFAAVAVVVVVRAYRPRQSTGAPSGAGAPSFRTEDGTTPLGATPDAPTPDGVTAPLLSSTVNSTPAGDDPVSTLYGTAPPPAYA